MQIYLTTEKGKQNITDFVLTVRWSGDYRQCARVLEFDLLYPYADGKHYKPNVPNGSLVEMVEYGKVYFYGYVVSRSVATSTNSVHIKCFDRGFYLNGNQFLGKAENELPEDFAARVCRSYNIPVGTLAKTGARFTRLFLAGTNSLYQCIATLYTLAGRQRNKQYHLGFEGEQFVAREKTPSSKTLVLKGGSNLIQMSTSESIEKLVSEVRVYDEAHKLIRTQRDADRIKQYGLISKNLVQTKDDDKADAASEILREGKVQQKITVDSLGDLGSVAGGSVLVQDNHTGVFGVFYIDTDAHEWKKGQYYNKLTLNFDRLMNEQEVGTLPKGE